MKYIMKQSSQQEWNKEEGKKKEGSWKIMFSPRFISGNLTTEKLTLKIKYYLRVVLLNEFSKKY